MSSEADIDKLSEMANALLTELKQLKEAQQPGVLTAQVKLPSRWIADEFMDWIGGAFQEYMLAVHGQTLEVQGDGKTVIFVRRKQEQPDVSL